MGMNDLIISCVLLLCLSFCFVGYHFAEALKYIARAIEEQKIIVNNYGVTESSEKESWELNDEMTWEVKRE